MDAVMQAELSNQRIALERDREAVRALSALVTVERELSELFRNIGEESEEVNAGRNIRIDHWRNKWEYCLRAGRVSVVVRLKLFREFVVVINDLDARVSRIGEPAFPRGRPVGESSYIPYLNENREFCWSRRGIESAFPSTAELADLVVCQLVGLNEKKESGKLPYPLRIQTYGRQPRKSDSEEWDPL
jgi:hypothetical protein